MKTSVILVLSLVMFGCSLTGTKRAPEVVASCFSDGESQEQICKTQRVNEDSKVVTTRCIGTQNREALANLRGKCVEKICSEGSNTDCHTRGEFAVLEQYSELVKSRLFADEENPQPVSNKKNVATKEKNKGKTSGKSRMTASVKPVTTSTPSAASAEIDTDPSAKLPPEPVRATPVAATPPPAYKPVASDEDSEPPSMSITLKPAKPVSKKKSRATASTKSAGGEEGFKKVCIAKNESSAPEVLRGKCATRNCNAGKCTYKGRKEMFDWSARSTSATE